MSNNGSRPTIIEALILSSPEPLAPRRIIDLLENTTLEDITEAVATLNNRYMETGASFRIRKIAGGYQVYVVEDYAPYVEELLTRRRNMRLTRSALETLAIIAYRQPVTKMDIELIRGVASDSVIHTLMERKLITLAGRAQSIGRPLLYRTTDEFLKYFNLNSLDDLPKMEEIEELLSSREPDTQPRLPLELDAAANREEDSEAAPDEILEDQDTGFTDEETEESSVDLEEFAEEEMVEISDEENSRG
ncbi:MAG: SMC-Scp complex subunit ScpB [Candidatus Zixiibacteriota bacterium]